MADLDLLEKVKKHVVRQYEEHAIPQIGFHNLDHTIGVIKAVMLIAAQGKLLKKELVLLEIAAWFHDIGYLEDSNEYKQNSAKTARVFLEQQNTPEPLIKRITDLVMATKLNQQALTPLEEIICDADFFFLSKRSFKKKSELLRKETEFLEKKDISRERWTKDMILLLEQHQYYTAYCRSELSAGKDKNLEKLRLQLSEMERGLGAEENHHTKRQEKELEKAEASSEKGIDTMFRMAASNNQRLFTLADNKAHILITANSIMMSVIISVVLRKLAENPFLTWPTFILLGTSFVSTIFSILATRPRLDGGTFSQSDLDQKEVNLIYFGNFYKMTVSEYINGMEVIMADRQFLYRTMIRDTYWHGMILGKKFGFLRKAYNVFLFGLTISIAAFVIAFLIHHNVPLNNSTLPAK
jgi:predicted metal-dependent HD superfamily phosphohydrolase